MQSDACVADGVPLNVPGRQLVGTTDMMGQYWPVGQA